MEDIDPGDAAYCAGLFEGEGYVGCYYKKYKNTTYTYITLSVDMNDKEPLLLFWGITGIGSVIGPYRNSKGGGTRFRYRVSKKDEIEFICNAMWKWLSPRRKKQFEDAIHAVSIESRI